MSERRELTASEMSADQAAALESARAATLRVRFDNIPQEMRGKKRWCVWRWVWQQEGDGAPRLTKPPKRTSGSNAKSDNPTTWSTFGAVRAAYESGNFDGIGFFTSRGPEGDEDNFVGVDLDDKSGAGKWIDTDGQPTSAACEILAGLGTYCEPSPSGKGLRAFGKGFLPFGGRNNQAAGVELYDIGSAKFLTVTGHRFEQFPATVNECEEALGELHRKVWPPKARPAATSGSTSTEGFQGGDVDLLSRAFQAKNGPKVQALYDGNTAGYKGPSEADMALALCLAFYTGPNDPERLERLMRGSALVRDKWNETRGTSTWLRRFCVEPALTLRTEFYSPPGTDEVPESFVRRPVPSAHQQERDAERVLDGFVVEERPEIDVQDRQDRDIVSDAWKALSCANEKRPVFYVQGAGVKLLASDLDGNPYTQDASPENVAKALRHVADWVKVSARGRGDAKTFVKQAARFPLWVAISVREDTDAAAHLPRLRGVVSCPVVTADGDLLTEQGYHPGSGLYLSSPPVALAGRPTKKQAQEALGRVFSAFEQFPYQGSGEDKPNGDRANAIAFLLTPFLRHYITGSVPLFVVEAPTPGTGKSLLARTLLAVSTPGRIITDGPSERERGAAEEWSKHLGAILSLSPAAILFDNLRGMISSGTLENLLTNPESVAVRILGKSQMQKVDASGLTMGMTGNNALFQHDMSRRSVFIRLDANMERPEDRTDFEITDLDLWVKQNRSVLLSDVALILSAWIAAGRPEGPAVKGSFERWAAVLSGVLEFLGVEGFLAGDRDRADAADPETMAWRGFFAAWWETHKDREVTAKQLVSTDVDDGHGFVRRVPGLAIEHEIIPEGGSSKALAKRLNAYRDRVFAGYRLTKKDDRTGVGHYRLRLAEPPRGVL